MCLAPAGDELPGAHLVGEHALSRPVEKLPAAHSTQSVSLVDKGLEVHPGEHFALKHTLAPTSFEFAFEAYLPEGHGVHFVVALPGEIRPVPQGEQSVALTAPIFPTLPTGQVDGVHFTTAPPKEKEPAVHCEQSSIFIAPATANCPLGHLTALQAVAPPELNVPALQIVQSVALFALLFGALPAGHFIGSHFPALDQVPYAQDAAFAAEAAVSLFKSAVLVDFEFSSVTGS
jgi:hypothetical protein